MPILTSFIPETVTHVTDPIMRQVVHSVIRKIGLTEIFKNNVHIRTKYASNSTTMDDDMNINLTGDKFVADATLQQIPLNTEWDMTTFSHSPAYGVLNNVHRNRPIFNDKEFGICLHEQAAPFSVRMSCSMYFKDKELAYRLPLILYNQFMNGSVFNISDIMYDYPLGVDVQYVLGEIYQRKQYTKQFESYMDYLKHWSEGRISINMNRDGSRPEVVVLKHNVEILTKVEYNDDEPDTETSGNSTTPTLFKVSFNLVFQFNFPNMLILKYPILIENKLLPIEAISLPTQILHKMKKEEHTDFGFQQLYEYTMLLQRDCIHLPFYDDWVPQFSSPTMKYQYMPFLIAAQLIDEDSEVNTVDLKEPIGGDLKLPELVLTLLRQQEEVKPRSSFAANAIINISVFYGDEELRPDDFNLSEDLVFTFKGRRLNNVYRLVIGEQRLFYYLDPIQYNVMVKHLWNFDIYTMRALWRHVQGGHVSLEIPPFWLPEGWWRGPDNCFYDQQTGERLFCLGDDMSWIDKDGNKHYPTIKEKDNGYGFISRIWIIDFQTWYIGRS